MKSFLRYFLAISLALATKTAFAQYKITTTIPGTDLVRGKTGITIGTYISQLWLFGLLIGGLLAFVSIVYAAIEWTVSAGNESRISDAKDRIFEALKGLVLLFGAYLILYFINPALVQIGATEELLNNLPAVQQATSPAATAPCPSCSQVRPPIPASGEKYLNNSLIAELKKLAKDPRVLDSNQSPIWLVKNAFPPSGDQESKMQCHNLGTCVDIALRTDLSGDCDILAKLLDTVNDRNGTNGGSAHGFGSDAKHTYGCAGIVRNFETDTPPHIHLELPGI